MKDWLRHCLSNACRIGAIVVAVAVPTALLLTHVWYQFRITRLGYQISEQTDRHEKLVDTHRKLEIEATVESRSEGLTEFAKRRYGLERVDPEQIITVRKAADAEGRAERASRTALDETEHASLERERAE